MVSYKTLVIGASTNQERYSYQAVIRLMAAGIEVVPMGIKSGTIGEIYIIPPLSPEQDIHTVSLYLAPERQKDYFDYIIELQPKRVIFNPGTEHPAFAKKLTEVGIFWENACNLVLLSTNQYQSKKSE
jgi:predicted CoA-binding protein